MTEIDSNSAASATLHSPLSELIKTLISNTQGLQVVARNVAAEMLANTAAYGPMQAALIEEVISVLIGDLAVARDNGIAFPGFPKP